MRLSLVTETFLPQVNGVSRTLSHLTDELTRLGVEVQVVHPDYGEAELGPHRVAVRSVVLPWYKDVSLPVPPFFRAHRAIDAFRPDIVHIATEATLGLATLFHARRRGYPVVSSFHTNWNQYSGHYRVGFARGLIMAYVRWFHHRVAETYVPSMATIEELQGCGFRNLVLWPRGVDGELFRPTRPRRNELRSMLGFEDEHVVVGHVSRLAPEKNTDFLAGVLRSVAESRPQARFLIVGDGPARGAFQAAMGPHARFVGYRTGEDLADHYAACDLFAFTSLTETFGNVVLEAKASGLPVVAIRAGGVGDIVQPGVTGELVDPHEPPSAMVDRIVRLIDDEALRRRQSAEARVHALSQTWHAVMSRLLDRYRGVVDRARSKAGSARS